ncbi:helix-turn-helix transcriptional regulator [Streptosporangium saharense]|uniref:helix-turn-helix transcriptional regulator n=1 Tax=Streptosporangium saharense TaxID=1706840 RepID=UPI0034307FEA
MDNRSEVRAFLTSRRAKVSPQQAGLPSHGRRRVEGLRRGEVAALAGVSVEYYTRLERGNLAGASDGVLDAIARALRLDDTETAHLHHLARAAATPAARARRVRTPEVRAPVRRVLESMSGVPALVRDHRFDILAANPLAMALYAPMFAAGEVLPVNSMRFTFLNPHAQGFYPGWAQVARSAVAALRIAAARNPHDEQLAGLIGELSMRSDPFRTWWAAQDVYVHQHGTKRFRHPAVGDLDLDYEVFELPGETPLTLLTYSAEPGTSSGDGLHLLTAWATSGADAPAQARRGTA